MSIENLAEAGPETTTQVEAGAQSAATEDRYAGILDLDAQEPEQQDNPVQEAVDESEASGEELPEIEEIEADPMEGYEDFEIDGKTVKIPSDIKPYLLRQADYTRKTQEVAEARRELEAKEQQIAARQQLSEQEFNANIQLANINAELKAFEGIDWNQEAAKLSEDPIGFQDLQRQHMRWQQLREAQGQLAGFLGQAQQQKAIEQQQDFSRRAQETQSFAAKNIKNWTPDLDLKITQFAETQGFTREQLNAALSPAVYKMLHDAYQYNAVLSRQSQARPSTTGQKPSPTRTVSAKANPSPTVSPSEMTFEQYEKWRKSAG